jgi:hypothetical protein
MKSRNDVFDMSLVLGNINTCRKEKFQASINTKSSQAGDTCLPHVLFFGPKNSHQDRLHDLCPHATSFGCFKIWSAISSSIVNTLFLDRSRFPWQLREKHLTYYGY